MKVEKIENLKSANYCINKEQFVSDNISCLKNINKFDKNKPELESDDLYMSKKQANYYKAAYQNNIKMQKSSMDNLRFKVTPLKFLPEDEAKMANMSIEEKIEYLKYLKSRNIYTIDYSKEDFDPSLEFNQRNKI